MSTISLYDRSASLRMLVVVYKIHRKPSRRRSCLIARTILAEHDWGYYKTRGNMPGRTTGRDGRTTDLASSRATGECPDHPQPNKPSVRLVVRFCKTCVRLPAIFIFEHARKTSPRLILIVRQITIARI